ncbi:MAG TPA: DUF4352 domain-containing protein [Anaerolineae bacterium]|nr:DUF4352 domain-containing protein [Anaerolineae bacterium]
MGFEKRPGQRRRTVLLSLAAALVLAGASCFSAATPAPRPALRPTNTPASTATPTPTRTPAPLPTLTPTPTSTPPYQITTITAGETLALGDLVLTVAPIAAIDAAPAAQPGRQLVLLDVAIQNVGEQMVSINAARDLVLKDSADQFYKINAAAVAAIRGTTPDVDLTPGETVRAQLGFDVPAEARDLTLSFAADRFRAGRIFVRLPAASQAALPPATETPTEIPTETPAAPAVLTATVALPAEETVSAAPTATLPPAAAGVAVALLEPNDGDVRSGVVTFRWAVTDGALPAGQAYELFFYRAGQDPLRDGFGLTAPVVDSSVQVNLAGLDADPNFPLDPGPFLWGVRLVQQSTGSPVSVAAEGRRLVFERTSLPSTAPTSPPPPPPTSAPPPTPTNPPEPTATPTPIT